jgi:alpha,alpha-trehalase
MKMKINQFCTAGVSAVLLFMAGCRSTPETAPLYPEKWDEIANYIKESWPKYVESNPNLPKPYIYGLNPGTLYYWDFYFHNEGLLMQGYEEIARDNLECMIFQVEKLGFIPNASGWGEDRSQSPFFALGVRSYWDKVKPHDMAWLQRAYLAVVAEYRFYTDAPGAAIEDHTSTIPGLQHFGYHSDSAALITFYDRVVAGRFKLPRDVPAEEKLTIASHRMAEAACMDFTPRFEGRCLDYIAVDLNSLLFAYERNIAFFERELHISDGKEWDRLADARAKLIDTYCWNEERGLYLDYDFVNGHPSPVASLAGWYPLFTGMASKEKARRVRDNLSLFESDGGLITCEMTPQEIDYQWGHNTVWAPLQHIAIQSMEKYGFEREAKEIAMRWLNTTTKNYVDPHPATYPPFKYGKGTRYPGALYEKYSCSGDINDAEYPCSEMLGWTATAYLVALETVRGN